MASSTLGLRGARGFISTTASTTMRMRPHVSPIARCVPYRRSPSLFNPIPYPRFHNVGVAAVKEQFAAMRPPSMTKKNDDDEKFELTNRATETIRSVLPGTLIAPPLSQWPREIKPFFRFAYDIFVQQYLRGMLQAWGLTLMSKPTTFKGRRYKLNNAKAILEIKALHRALGENMAEGNKDVVSNILTMGVSKPFLHAIDIRPKNRRYKWEIVRYLAEPKILQQMMTPLTKGYQAPMMRQVVVRIKSRQRKTEYTKTKAGEWVLVPGSEQEIDATENVVGVAMISTKLWKEDGGWRLLGTIDPVTPELWWREKAAIEAFTREQDEILVRQNRRRSKA